MSPMRDRPSGNVPRAKWANERVMFDGEPIVLGFMPTPQAETAAEVAERLGLKVGQIPYRFPMPGPGAAGTS